MTTSHGYRSRTRHKFKKPFRRNGVVRMKNVLSTFKKGEIVDIIVDGAIHRGMPHHFYHGRTGRIFNVNKRSVGVRLEKKIGNRKLIKRVHVLVNHIRKSNVKNNFLERIKKNQQLSADAKAKNETIFLKRQPKMPENAKTVSFNL